MPHAARIYHKILYDTIIASLVRCASHMSHDGLLSTTFDWTMNELVNKLFIGR
jgi:hypothetical protein